MKTSDARKRIPEWLKLPAAGGETYSATAAAERSERLTTVCEEARCPNRGECWSAGTATAMIMGDVCTRSCRFCAVKKGAPTPLDEDEPERLAAAAKKMGLKYVVVTSVDRDDLPDFGAGHFAKCVKSLKRQIPGVLTEVLTPDFNGDENCLETVLSAGADVFAHNIETVRELSPRIRDRRCDYEKSLVVLREAKRIKPGVLTKSSVMVGLGETAAQIEASFIDLRAVGVDVITIGQYLRPTRRHMEVSRYYEPAEFEKLREMALSAGFEFVASAPRARSSYRAAELYAMKRLSSNRSNDDDKEKKL